MTDTHTSKTTLPSFTRNIIWLLLVLFFIAAIAFAVYTNQRLSKTIQTLVSDNVVLKQDQRNAQALLNSTIEKLNSQQLSVDKQLNDVSKDLSQALQERWYQNNDWLLLKARYYIEMAEINAHWSDNRQTTSTLLQQADKLLANVHDPELFTVRQTIAKEISQLEEMPTLDVVGLLSKLDAAQQLLTDLPVKNPFTLAKTNITPGTTNSASTNWRTQLQNSIQLLEKLVVIRHHDEAIQPLLAPEYESLLRESIFLNLQETQWAVIQRNQNVYRLSLSQAISTIKRAFDLKASHTQALLQQLDALQQTQLDIPKPTKGESLLLLNQLIESKKGTSANTTTPVSGEPS